ncbi:MAG: biotin--[Spirochaetales bacterium]|nr:biotin--[acetyl-CoA-carboxylase] ligase [Spirochaetales bacterium]
MIDLHEYDCLDSTNRLLMDMAKEGSSCGTAVWAHRQTGGRGRLGRSFCSPEGGIYVSILVPVRDSIMITAMAGVAVMRTISQVCDKKCGIKWVNDIIYEGKKVCGILAQGSGDKAVVGIGINYRTDISALPEDVRSLATSLYGPGEDAPDERIFVRTLLENVYGLICDGDEKWLEEYKASSTILGKEVLIMQAGKVTGEGVATGIDDSCALHVTGPDGRETVLSAGEVSVRSK